VVGGKRGNKVDFRRGIGENTCRKAGLKPRKYAASPAQGGEKKNDPTREGLDTAKGPRLATLKTTS